MSRRSLAADRPSASMPVDGDGLMEEEEFLSGASKKRSRRKDENYLSEQRFQRLRLLEDIFGCSAANPRGRKP